MTGGCLRVREYLRDRWIEEPALSAPSEEKRAPGEAEGHFVLDDAQVQAHLARCSACRSEADALRHLHRMLENGFSRLLQQVAPLSDDVLQETVRRVREDSPEVQCLRRIRRPLRLILWGVLYAFTLLGVSVLAVALYRVLRAL
jgi:predicted anti-sigma-YlaC factor YlaD